MEVKEVKRPKVSIWSITYNHAPFIKDCLEGILKQETNFDFELIIGDDASTDGTSDILRDYAARYPEIIKPIIQEKNIGIYANSFENVYPKLVGEYIAICEGDDYWGDPYKLQKQVDFLDRHSEYVVTYHRARVINSEGKVVSEDKWDCYKDISSEDLIYCKGEMITSTVLFRNVLKSTLVFKDIINADTLLWHLLGFYGDAKFIDQIIPSSYRVHDGGVWSSKNSLFRLTAGLKTYQVIQKNLLDKNFRKFNVKIMTTKMVNDYFFKLLGYRYFLEYLRSYRILFKYDIIPKFFFLRFHFLSILNRFKL